MGLSETLNHLCPCEERNFRLSKVWTKSAGEISQQFDLALATVSHHLSTLRKAGLIEEKKNRKILSTIV